MTATMPLFHVERGEGTPLIMVHGYTVDHRLLLPLEAVFDGRPGWRRIYVDLPGHGRSPRLNGRVTAGAVAGALLDFIDATTHGEPFAVLGQSFGGQMVRHVLAERRDRVQGMALLAPLVLPHGERSLPEHQALERDEELLASLPPEDRADFLGVGVWQNRGGWEAFREHVLPGLRACHREDAAELLKNYLLPIRPEERIATDDRPHLLLTGRQDGQVGWRDQMDLLLPHYPRMTSVTLGGAGHNLHLDRPAQAHALLGAWLDELADHR